MSTTKFYEKNDLGDFDIAKQFMMRTQLENLEGGLDRFCFDAVEPLKYGHLFMVLDLHEQALSARYSWPLDQKDIHWWRVVH